MATLNIKNLPEPLYDALKLRAEEQHRSISQEVTHILAQALAVQPPRSIMELQGLGKEAWSGIDAARHVAEERDSWD